MDQARLRIGPCSMTLHASEDNSSVGFPDYVEPRLPPLPNPFLSWEVPRHTGAKKRCHSFAHLSLAHDVWQQCLELPSGANKAGAAENVPSESTEAGLRSQDVSEGTSSDVGTDEALRAVENATGSILGRARGVDERRRSDTHGDSVAGQGAMKSTDVHARARASDADEGLTLMVRNLPRTVDQCMLLSKLMADGFWNQLDFAYLPAQFGRTKSPGGKGFAFVGTRTAAAAQALTRAWHQTHAFGREPGLQALNLSMARTQGREANLKLWGMSKTRRIRNARFRPHLMDAQSNG
uniref:RRM domain-containing protein n=1 Tax=Noctiluca scintillans TaxID=2966 RepID=A0A7S1AAY1_NOCSC